MRKRASETIEENTSESTETNDAVTYDVFAPYYDHYMRHVDYDKWTEKILNLYAQHSNTGLKDILELACGTACISERLVSRGYDVTASDRSPEMLRYASLKECKPKLLLKDMTSEHAEDSFDLVMLVFDSINYLLDKHDINLLFNNVSKSLHKNGLFIFDISTHRNSVENFTEYVNIDETQDYMLIHRADFDTASRLQRTKMTIFKSAGNNYIRTDEEHKQRVYNVQELLEISESSPLECCGIYCLVYDKNLLKTNTRKLDHQYSRLFFVMKKGKDA